MTSQSPIALAEQLLELVKTVYQPASSHDHDHDQSIDAKDAYNYKNRISAICDELKRDVLGAAEYTVLLAESCQESSALRFVSELGVADIIADETLSLQEISKKAGVDARYLSITMNCLLAHGYFEEVEVENGDDSGAQVFRNNAMSNVLRSGQEGSLKEAIGFICDEGLKSTSYLLEVATSGESVPDHGPDQEEEEGAEKENATKENLKNPSGANAAFHFDGPIFEWMAAPERSWRGKRMGKAMQQLHRVANGAVIYDFEWNGLSSPIVDIGGGIGSLEIAFLRAHPESALNFIIFDIPQTVENAKKIWSTDMAALQERVSFVSGDFLAPTLEGTGIPKGKPTYLIRHVLHDWEDDEVVAILRNVREAMTSGLGSNTSTEEASRPKLLLCEMLLQPTSPRFVRTTSMQILALNNGMTRTEKDMIRLVNEAGFTVAHVHNMRSADSIIEAFPIIA